MKDKDQLEKVFIIFKLLKAYKTAAPNLWLINDNAVQHSGGYPPRRDVYLTNASGYLESAGQSWQAPDNSIRLQFSSPGTAAAIAAESRPPDNSRSHYPALSAVH